MARSSYMISLVSRKEREILMNAETVVLWQVVIAVINLLVLIATLIVLIFYTTYTYRMQKAVESQSAIANAQTDELIRQRKLANLPAFVAELHQDRSSNRLDVRNIGKGVALNIKVHDVQVPHEQHPDARIVLPSIATINPGEKIHPGLAYVGLGDRDEQNRAMNRPPIQNYLNNETYDLRVSFVDLEGTKYEQVLAMDRGHCVPRPVRAMPTDN